MLGWFRKKKKKDPVEGEQYMGTDNLESVAEEIEQIEQPTPDQPPEPVEAASTPAQIAPETDPQVAQEETGESIDELEVVSVD